MLYILIMSDGLGNSMFSDNPTLYLKKTQKALTEKYGSQDYRTRFVVKCVIISETKELDIQDKEWVRYILHEESEPDGTHENLLADLKERLES